MTRPRAAAQTPPMCVSDASVAKANTASGKGWVSGTAAVRAALMAMNELCMAGCHFKVLGLPLSVSVSGRRVRAAAGRKQR